MRVFNRRLTAVAVLAAVVVLGLAGSAWATFAFGQQTGKFFRGKHVNISMTVGSFDEVDNLHYESVLKNIDGFADSLKRKGKLSLGKINLHLTCGDVENICRDDAYNVVEMYRHKKGYYCSLNGCFLSFSQDYLTKIIAYFASDNWESFCTGDREIKPDIAARIFNRRIDTITVSRKYAPKKAKDAGNGVEVYFQNDSLICKDAKRVYGKIGCMLPFSAGSKAFITAGTTFYVVEGGAVINEIELTRDDVYPPRYAEEGYDSGNTATVFPGWVNFHNSYGCFLSYSRAENKFYKLKVEHPWE
jgi:hypothetical protein